MKQVALKIDGMKCGMCEAHINDNVRHLDGIKKVSSSHIKGTCQIICEDNVSIEDIKGAITKDGYHVLDEESTPYEKKGLFARIFKK